LGLLGVSAALVLAACGALILLGSADRPWLKHRIQKLARSAAGVDIDYRSAHVAILSGATIEGFVVHSPAEVRAFAPDLLRVGSVRAHWSLRSLLSGHGPVLESVSASDVELSVVLDERGRSSFDALSAAGNPPPPAQVPSVPLSGEAAHWLSAQPPLARLAVDHITLALLRTARGQLFDRSQLRGLSLALASRPALPAERGWRVDAALGSSERPLELEASRAVAGAAPTSARALFWLAIDASPANLHTALDLHMLEQTFISNAAGDHQLHAQAHLHFDAAAGRTEVSLDHAESRDGALQLEAVLELPDNGAPSLPHARADVDLARLLAWLPVGLVPVTVERAQLQLRVSSLALGSIVRLSQQGALDADAEISKLAVETLSAAIAVQSLKLSLRAQQPSGAGIAGRGTLALSGVQLRRGPGSVTAEALTGEFEGAQMAEGAITGRAALRFGRIASTSSAQPAGAPLIARDGRVELGVRALKLGADTPTATAGDVSLAVDLAALELASGAGRARADGVSFKMHAALSGHAPYAAELSAGVKRFHATRNDGTLLVDAPATVAAELRDLTPDLLHPAASSGIVRVEASIADVQLALAANQRAAVVHYDVSARARTLKLARAFLSAKLLDTATCDRMSVAFHSAGDLDHVDTAQRSLRQAAELSLGQPAFWGVAATALSLKLKSQGNALQHKADLEVSTHGLAFAGAEPNDDHVTLSLAVDRKAPSLAWQLASDGHARTQLSGKLAFDAGRKALAYELHGELSGLGPLVSLFAKARALAGVDVSKLEFGLKAHGTLFGVVSSVAPDGKLAFEASPARSAWLEGSTELHLAHVRWSKGALAMSTPDFAWHADMHGEAAHRELESHFEIGTLHVDVGSHEIDLNGVSDQASAVVSGNLAEPEFAIKHRLGVRAIEQTLVPEYPLGDLDFAIEAERSRDGVVHVAELKLDNARGGSSLALSGNLDLGDGRRTLALTTSLSQDLARLSTIPERMQGRGKLAAAASITSPDFTHYHVRAALKADDVNLKLPRSGIDLTAANAEVPVTVELELGERGVGLVRKVSRNPYSMLRFSDQLPLLRRSGFVSIGRIQTPFVSIAPLVGNLEIEQNVVSLRQFEMGVRGGSITGQCALDWDGPKSTLELHVRANGVRSSHGEPFDGNIAVAISAGDRTIDGRAEILRIGERHLLDLLDLHDPQHVDAAMNRIRSALNFGYPDSLRLVFDHGFASAHLELGGLAQFVSIGELRGIPMGPIVDRMIAQMLGTADAKEMP
jgi:hypothetical protein